MTRTSDPVPAGMTAKLLRAETKRQAAENELKRTVREAVPVSSVRSVAAVLGMSPTTIQRWVHEAS